MTGPDPPAPRRILLTGATGYVGGRLLPVLVARGYRVRCLARRPDALRSRVPEGVEVVPGDLLEADSLPPALEGVHSAVYLVHSMGSGAAFADADLRAARNFGEAARQAEVQRIVYLGGLGDPGSALSPHLISRQQVGEALRAAGAPVIELRASVILGSGSFSFEMIRALVERLPVMVTPRWVRVPTQPIYINDVLAYLLAALERPTPESRVFEIGGPDVLSYGELMQEYARQRGLRRFMIPVPFLTPRLSSIWLGLVTPLYARVGRTLIDGIRSPTVVRDPAALREFNVQPTGVREAIRKVLLREDVELARTHWSDAAWSRVRHPSWGGVRFGNRLVDSRALETRASAAAAFQAVEGIGGERGWYAHDFLWRARGWLDLLLGGVGMRRGRRDPDRLSVGDWLDCWSVEAIEPGRRLRLASEMRLPGRAWLEFEVAPSQRGASVRMTATFDPLGLAGLAYWYALWPLHELVFAGMLKGVGRAAEGRR